MTTSCPAMEIGTDPEERFQSTVPTQDTSTPRTRLPISRGRIAPPPSMFTPPETAAIGKATEESTSVPTPMTVDQLADEISGCLLRKLALATAYDVHRPSAASADAIPITQFTPERPLNALPQSLSTRLTRTRPIVMSPSGVSRRENGNSLRTQLPVSATVTGSVPRITVVMGAPA